MQLPISEWDQVVKNVNAFLESGVERGELELPTLSLWFERTEDSGFKLEVQKDG